MSHKFKHIWIWGRWERNRPTEMQALHLLLKGWYPSLNGASSLDDIEETPTHTVTPIDWNCEPTPHHNAIGRKCTNCNKRKPLTRHYFDTDSTCRAGLKTICKVCRRKYQNEHNRKKRNSIG